MKWKLIVVSFDFSRNRESRIRIKRWIGNLTNTNITKLAKLHRYRCFRNGNVDMGGREKKKKKKISRVGLHVNIPGRKIHKFRKIITEKLLLLLYNAVSYRCFNIFRDSLISLQHSCRVILQNFVLRTSISYIAVAQPRSPPQACKKRFP